MQARTLCNKANIYAGIMLIKRVLPWHRIHAPIATACSVGSSASTRNCMTKNQSRKGIIFSVQEELNLPVVLLLGSGFPLTIIFGYFSRSSYYISICPKDSENDESICHVWFRIIMAGRYVSQTQPERVKVWLLQIHTSYTHIYILYRPTNILLHQMIAACFGRTRFTCTQANQAL